MMNDQTNCPTLPELDARLSNVLSYWDTLRGDRVAPGRVEIRPSEITRHLSRICILERPRAGTVRMRLAGATLSARMGMELRGMPLRALFDLDHRNIAMDAAETAMTTPAVSILALAWLIARDVDAPIIGATKEGHLDAAVAALDVELTAEEIERLEAPYVPKPMVGLADPRPFRGTVTLKG